MPFAIWTRVTKRATFIAAQSGATFSSTWDAYGKVANFPIRTKTFRVEGSTAHIDDLVVEKLMQFQQELLDEGHPHGKRPILLAQVSKLRVDNQGYLPGGRYVGGNSRFYLSVNVDIEPGIHSDLRMFSYPPDENFGYRNCTRREAALRAFDHTETVHELRWPKREP